MRKIKDQILEKLSDLKEVIRTEIHARKYEKEWVEDMEKIAKGETNWENKK